MTGEVEKWRAVIKFLAHEDQWNTRGAQHQRGSELSLLEGNQVRKAVSVTGVRDLIVVLKRDYEPVAWFVLGGTPETAFPVWRVGAVVDETLRDRLPHVFQAAEAAQESAPVAGQVANQ